MDIHFSFQLPKGLVKVLFILTLLEIHERYFCLTVLEIHERYFCPERAGFRQKGKDEIIPGAEHKHNVEKEVDAKKENERVRGYAKKGGWRSRLLKARRSSPKRSGRWLTRSENKKNCCLDSDIPFAQRNEAAHAACKHANANGLRSRIDAPGHHFLSFLNKHLYGGTVYKYSKSQPAVL